MKIEISKKESQTIVALDGMLDSNTAPEFQETVSKLLEQEMINIVFDLGKLTYTSSQGIRTFLSLLKTASSRNGNLVFRNIQPAVLEVFDMSGISQVMKIE